MTSALTPAIQLMRDTASPAIRTDETRPVVMIDLDLAEIVAANASGAQAIGLFAYASFPIGLDASTPALARLRELAGLGNANGKAIERLTFWSNGRLRPVRCTVARQGNGESGVFVLRIIDENGAETPAAAPSSRSEADAHPTPEISRPALPGDPDHLAKLAHELKTPLTAIAAAAEVMRDERLGAMGNERYLTYAADIHESATHALDVITALLSESTRPDAAIPRLIALDLNAVVERTASSMQALAQSRGLSLNVEPEKSRPHIVANPTSLRQILLNLLTNAIKFTPSGGDVRVVTGYLADGRVFLAVHDTGCGMSGDAVAETGPADDKPQPWLTGNGIGLPLVQRLVQEMGAELEIDSAPEKGTVVLIAFGSFARWPT